MSSIRGIQRAQQRLLLQLSGLAERAMFGSLSETYRTCGQPDCRCKQGERHGPHLYISFRGQEGKTTGYYVPKVAERKIREGVAAWQTLQERLRELAELTKDEVLQRAKEDREG